MFVCGYPSYDANGLVGQEARVAHFVIHDAVEHLLFVIPGERRLRKHKGCLIERNSV